MSLSTSPPPDSDWSEVDGTRMFSVHWTPGTPAAGPDLVLVHGLGMSCRYMAPVALELAKSCCVHAPDLPGFGRSGKPSLTLTVPELADALEGWIRQRGLRRPVLIGNSLGAQVIADYAARYPDALSGAVLNAPTIDPGARRMSVQILRLMRDIPREPVSLYRIALTDYLKAGPSRILRTLRHALRHDVSTALSRIRVPVLLVRGGRDPIIPDSWMQSAVELVPSSRLVTIPAAAHAVNFNAPEPLASEVLKFLAETSVFSHPRS